MESVISQAHNIDSDSGLLNKLLRYVDPNECEVGHPIHGLHPYPAKYIPDLPREIIIEHTNERHTIFDPFCGSGTTLVEASLHGRKSIGVDSNPIATLISTAKTTPLNEKQIDLAESFMKKVNNHDPGDISVFMGHVIERQDHWFQKNMLNELFWIRRGIQNKKDQDLKRFLLCVFSTIITSVSRQDSDTRYKAIDKNLSDGYALNRYSSKLKAAIEAIRSFSENPKVWKNIPKIINASTNEVDSKFIPDSSVDLIVTSPPYPNSFDYYLYHKLRMAWLGFDFKKAQNQEIGSRYEHSSRRASIESFIAKMTPVMGNVARVLKPSKLAYFFVGDSVVSGNHINMSDLYKELTETVGLSLLDEVEYELASVSRSFKSTREVAGNGKRFKKMQRILVFERKNIIPTHKTKRPIASPVPQRKAETISSSVKSGSVVAISSDDQDRHIHSLASFPSKFIPEIPRWAITNFSQKGELVLDPFSGSGTSAVEALLAGRNAISVDVNPYACLLTSAKTGRAIIDELEISASKLQKVLDKRSLLPEAERLCFNLDDFWFNLSHLKEFAQIDSFIKNEISESLVNFFRASLSTTIRSFSYQDMSQIKVKRDPKKVLSGTPGPITLLMKKLPILVARYKEFLCRLPPNVINLTINASSHDLNIPRSREVDLIVTSPPYINAMNYAMATRYELLLLGLIDPDDLVTHQTKYFGTERVYSKQYKELRFVPETWSISPYLNPRLERIFQKEPKRAFIVYDFFMQMRNTLEKLIGYLKSNGSFILVAGTNNIRQVDVDTFNVLVSILKDVGLNIESSFHYEIIKQVFKITRHKTASIIPHDGVAILRKP